MRSIQAIKESVAPVRSRSDLALENAVLDDYWNPVRSPDLELPEVAMFIEGELP
jgi:hypothetical protein